MTTYDSTIDAITPLHRGRSKGAVGAPPLAPAPESVRAPDDARWPLLPWARGPLSHAVTAALRRSPGTFGTAPPIRVNDALTSDDFALALYLCYEPHFRGLADSDWRWDRDLFGFRCQLERVFIDRLRDEVATMTHRSVHATGEVIEDLSLSMANHSLAANVVHSGTLNQLREICIHSSAHLYRLSDPRGFALPRVPADVGLALRELDYDGSPSGDAARRYSTFFAPTMSHLALNTSIGSYVEDLPAATLAPVNLARLFAAHTRWRAALIGRFAVIDVTSGSRLRDYSRALERLGVGPSGRAIFNMNVDVSPRREFVARRRLVTGLLSHESLLASDVLFGATSAVALELRFARHLLGEWTRSHSTLISWRAKAG